MKPLLPLLLLLTASTPAFAQKVQPEEIPFPDILRYLNIDPTNRYFQKFSVTFPSPKFGALELKKTTDGKEELLNLITFGPDKVFIIEIFFDAPLPNLPPDKTYRALYYKLTAGSSGLYTGCVNSLEVNLLKGSTETRDADLPVFFTYKSDGIAYSLSFISSDTPIKDRPKNYPANSMPSPINAHP